ncbi:uncharacterized protein LOC110349552 [Heterocephalus glaber]|uniref:Uncharacterized protein LOC110349552 n=1 Tax=Heterocephalus glaber TaxID=10181 RepID=A0AAX6SYP2_HETGA|nr:uncharacterized protein LOC110349552 [Heterocephalus glaber]
MEPTWAQGHHRGRCRDGAMRGGQQGPPGSLLCCWTSAGPDVNRGGGGRAPCRDRAAPAPGPRAWLKDDACCLGWLPLAPRFTSIPVPRPATLGPAAAGVVPSRTCPWLWRLPGVPQSAPFTRHPRHTGCPASSGLGQALHVLCHGLLCQAPLPVHSQEGPWALSVAWLCSATFSGHRLLPEDSSPSEANHAHPSPAAQLACSGEEIPRHSQHGFPSPRCSSLKPAATCCLLHVGPGVSQLGVLTQPSHPSTLASACGPTPGARWHPQLQMLKRMPWLLWTTALR